MNKAEGCANTRAGSASTSCADDDKESEIEFLMGTESITSKESMELKSTESGGSQKQDTPHAEEALLGDPMTTRMVSEKDHPVKTSINHLVGETKSENDDSSECDSTNEGKSGVAVSDIITKGQSDTEATHTDLHFDLDSQSTQKTNDAIVSLDRQLFRGFGDGIRSVIEKMNPERSFPSAEKSRLTPTNSQHSQLTPNENHVSTPASAASQSEDEASMAESLVPSLYLPLMGESNDGSEQEMELAHLFKKHTFQTPTKCDICDGLLVGLWSQGLKCQACGMNVHHGQGKGDHDDCRAEALLHSCRGHCGIRGNSRGSEEDCQTKSADSSSRNFRRAIKEVRELAKNSPNFFQEVREQIDRDVKSHAKKLVVQSSAEEERSKSLRRLRERLVPFLERVDNIEKRGFLHAVLTLLSFHALVAGAIAFGLIFGFWLALLPVRGGVSFQALLDHTSTVLAAFHVTVLLLSIGLRQLSYLLQRKQMILDQFLRECFSLRVETDIGMSVQDAARRGRSWSDKFLLSSLLACETAVFVWYQFRHQA